MDKFHNRQAETEFLTRWIEADPNSILFVYGPKSSGKSTLMMHVLERLDPKKYVINYLDLRGVLLYDFNSFLNTFFQKSKSDKFRGLIEGITVNTGFFSVSVDEEDLLKKNPFKVMEGQLEKARKKGKMPVIVLDEIQMLKSIYLNGERHLIDELINLFIRLTKVRQLAHVVLLTSDSYFIEEIYNNSKLKKTVNLYLVEHFTEQETKKWLDSEGFSEDESKYVWEKIGGSVWEIKQVVLDVKQKGNSLEAAVQYYLDDEYGKLVEFIRTKTTDEESRAIQKVHKEITEKGFAIANDFGKTINPIIPKMVEHDFWFFRTDNQQITANSESIKGAMKRMLKIN